MKSPESSLTGLRFYGILGAIKKATTGASRRGTLRPESRDQVGARRECAKAEWVPERGGETRFTGE